jgi:hypothetical protein
MKYFNCTPFLSLLICFAFVGCVSRNWLTDGEISAQEKTPEQLISFLGSPAKIVSGQSMPPHEGAVTEYRYFVLDKSGELQYRRYFFDGTQWITGTFPFSSRNTSRYFRVLDPSEESDQRLIKMANERWSYMR